MGPPPGDVAERGDMAEHDNEAPNGQIADRRSADRRETDRRAFWRPTPDRRREATEKGRRETDAADRGSGRA